jgi:hypothetical protein
MIGRLLSCSRPAGHELAFLDLSKGAFEDGARYIARLESVALQLRRLFARLSVEDGLMNCKEIHVKSPRTL